MRENLALAIAYLAVPIAMLGFASPLVAALATLGSSILVTVKSLRTKHAPAE